jgi:hypothetical protein
MASYGCSPSLQVHARTVRPQMTAQLLLMHLGKNLILQGASKVTVRPQLLGSQERQACVHRIHVPQTITKIYFTDEQVETIGSYS